MAYCAVTRQAFDGLIKRPTLSDKLLQRPPFEFLHDIVTACMKSKPFLNGLFPPEHVNGKTMKGKIVKAAYLTPLINAVQFGVERKIDVKASRIIAGENAEQTNALLQALAEASKGVTDERNAVIVGRVRDGDVYEAPGSAGSNKENGRASAGEKKKTTKKSSSKERAVDGDNAKKTKSRHSSKDKEEAETKPKSKRKTSKDGKRRSSHTTEAVDEPVPSADHGEAGSSREPSDLSTPSTGAPEATDPDIDGAGQPRSPPRPSTSMGGGRPMTGMARPGTAMGGRPGTAKPAPPRIKRKELGTKVADAVDVTETTAAVITTNGDADDGEFVVEQSREEDELMPTIGGEQVDADDLDAAEHGGLVRKILETKKELESAIGDDLDAPTTTTVVLDEAERRRLRAETAKIQAAIQSLTRSAHPLAALLDYMQEDVDGMTRELETWRAEQRANNDKLKLVCYAVSERKSFSAACCARRFDDGAVDGAVGRARRADRGDERDVRLAAHKDCRQRRAH